MGFKKILDENSSTVFLFLYGLLAQIIAIPAIYYYNLAYKDMESVFETLIFIWYCIPVFSVFSIVIALIQIKRRRANQEKYKAALIGLTLNAAWLLSYLAFIYMSFGIGKPFLFNE